jgi:hypothetical protein
VTYVNGIAVSVETGIDFILGAPVVGLGLPFRFPLSLGVSESKIAFKIARG